MYRLNQISEYLHNKAMKERVPLDGTFELTPVCNMNCKMCYIRKSAAEQQAIAPLRTAEEWIDLAAVCRDRGTAFLLLTGGEPFIRPDFIKILSAVNHMGIVTTVNTNATLITEGCMKDLVDAGPTKLNITLYGASDETYGRLCDNPGGFSQVSKAIEMLQDNHIDVKLNMSITPYNVDDMEGMFRWAKERKLNCQAVSYMFPPIRKNAESIGVNDRFTPEEAARTSVMIEWLNMGTELFLKRYDTDHLPAPSGDDCTIPTEGTGIRCRAGGCCYWVTWEGKLLPCGIMPTEQAMNVFESGFDACWEQVKSYRDSIRMPAKCSVCDLKDTCKACAAMCVSETGAYDQIPQYRCDMYQCYGDEVKKFVEKLKA